MLLLILDVGSNIFQKNHILSHTPMGGGGVINENSIWYIGI